jgi:AcrR family transcriptional regulator
VCIVFQMVRQYASTSPERLAEAVFDVAASRGLDAASVREVAAAAGVSIGAVQHHFATKEQMLAFAFTGLVQRVRDRVAALDTAAPLAERLAGFLRQLLPLDAERDREARVMTAFAVRASTSAALGAIQRDTLAEIRTELSAALRAASVPRPQTRATLLIAVVDGLALDMQSSAGLYSPADVTAALDEQIALVLGDG